MIKRRARSRPRRSIRYVLLLTPDELNLAKKIAEHEFRPLPDFFRRHIYESAAQSGISISPDHRQDLVRTRIPGREDHAGTW